MLKTTPANLRGPFARWPTRTSQKRYGGPEETAHELTIRSSLLTDKLSNQARRKIEASADDITNLEFSIANVHGFLHGVLQSMGDIYKDMICDLFDSVIERSSDNVVFYKSWKSNQKTQNRSSHSQDALHHSSL